MNVVFWLLIIFALVVVWFLVVMVAVPMIQMYLKHLKDVMDDERRIFNDEKQDQK